jgi:uncharacterized repeat protein (TIGR03943 family)
MSQRTQNAVKALLLIAMGIFLYTRISNGSLLYYIAERFAWLTFLAMFGLIAVGLSYEVARRTVAGGGPQSAESEPGELPADDKDHDHIHGHGHAHVDDPLHEHHHGHSHGLGWGAVAILALPVVLGFLVSPRPLGVAAMQNREIAVGQTKSVLPAAVRAAAEKSNDDKNVLDWSQLFASTPNAAEAFAGSPASVVGFIYRDERFSADEFFLARFTISCCAADASPVGVVVRWPEAHSLADDQWVTVRGNFEAGDFDGAAYPVLVADSIVSAEVPSQPYLYP